MRSPQTRLASFCCFWLWGARHGKCRERFSAMTRRTIEQWLAFPRTQLTRFAIAGRRLMKPGVKVEQYLHLIFTGEVQSHDWKSNHWKALSASEP